MKNFMVPIASACAALVSAEEIFAVELVPGDRINMVWIQPGTFVMGSPANEMQRDPYNEIQHMVTLTSGFYMGKYPVTQGEYLLITGDNPSPFKPPRNDLDLLRPADNMRWSGATNYCALLTQQERAAGHIDPGWSYRLPTEAEWEYGCRAGTSTAFNFGNAIHGGDANFDARYEYDAAIGTTYVSDPAILPLNMTVRVGSYPPNAWGLYDMHGNVIEMCQDFSAGAYPTGNTVDPQGATVDTGQHPIRGGGYAYGGDKVRCAYRGGLISGQKFPGCGFRIVLAPSTSKWKVAITADTTRQDFVDIGDLPSGINSVVVITHGRIPSGDDPVASTAWVDSMSNSVASYLTAHSLTNWQIIGYKWESAAQASVFGVIGNAKQQGVSLGHQILALGYTHVHFIAHSAGAGLIQAATDVIKNPTTGNPAIVVHETFLDPYVNWDFSGTAKYGDGADWADNYSTKDAETHDEILPFTYNILLHSYNVDVTYIDMNDRVQRPYFVSGSGSPCYVTESVHGWPIDFYSNSIVGSVTSDYDGFGFPLSEEAGGWSTALTYAQGNGAPGHILGTPDSGCSLDMPAPSYPVIPTDFLNTPSLQSDTGTIEKYLNGSVKYKTGSPAWLATFITVTNPANVVAFDAEFQSLIGTQGLLSVYWDGDNIGSIDERAVQAGFQHYTFKFPTAASYSLHTLGLRLDPFTNVQSIIVLTNVVTTASGVTQPFSLAITGSTSSSLVYQLTGQPGFEYTIQASANLINWTNIASLANTNGTVQFFDQDSANYGKRFYRAVAPY